ncbi:hypothetical protein Acr_03g0019960 [Actinidia rufa]|uniref:Transposase (putative) gypsy type domain-containing protein n=1 Tax=Actinidia rufa TaxID=165716 RepID=A0A7J0EFT5_9ERIC|nr:hypothetical protein Acr_03g0019960 [Actinidia rufa]
MLKGRPAQTNKNKGLGRGRSKPLRRGDQTKAMTADGVMGRVRGSRRDPRKDEYGKISRRYRRHIWKDRILVEMESLEMESGDGDPKYSTSPTARRRQYFNSDQLMSILMMALASSVETAWRGSVDSFYLGQEGSEIEFGVLNAGTGLRRMDVWRCSVSLRARLKLSDLAKVVAQKAATSASKGVVISEGSETTSGKRALDDGSKGKQVAQSPEPKKARIDTGASRAPAKPPVASGAGSSAHRTLGEALGPQASVMASAATAEKILAGVILPADKEKVDKLTFDQVVTKFIHALGQGVILGSSLAVRSRDFAESALNQKAVVESAEIEMVRAQNRAIELEGALAEEKAMEKKLAEDADARSKVIAKLEARISELEKSQSLTQGRIIATFKESDDFLEAVRGSASSYFGDGFDFCKRQLAHQYPDLGVDLEDVEMDHEFLAKEEAEAEQRAAEEGAAGAEGVERRRTHPRSHVDEELNTEWVVSAGKWFNGGNSGFHTSEVGTLRDLGRWARSITALPYVYINGVNLSIRTFSLLSKCCSVFKLHLTISRSAVPFMFSKTNLGGEESEQSLPSWISDHLGAKSYIDETSQSPSFLPTNSPKMDTSSLTKEGNAMSQAELDKLGSTYSFPSRIRLRIPGDGETILSARQGEVAFYEAAFLAGLRLPLHPTIREILIHYKICPAQLSPNAWRSVICSLVVWRHFKRHMSCDEFRCLYSLSPLPDSGWYYFKARPEKNLFRGSPSNVKGWKTRFFFASGDEWEFPSGVATSDITARVPRSWGTPDIFAVGCTVLSTSGGENATSGDEGEFVTREDSVEYLGVIRRDIGGVIRRAHPGIPDETLLRWLGGKVKDPFTNLLSGTSGSSSDSGSVSISDSELPPELRSDGREGNEDSQASTKGVVIREKRTQEGNPLIEIGEPDSSKGKEAESPLPPKRFKSNRRAINAKGRAGGAGTSSPGGDMGSESMSDASVARRLLTGVIPASDKKEVDQLSENELVAKSFHALGQVVVFASSLALRSQEHLHDMDFHMARADSAELELVKAQNRAVEGHRGGTYKNKLAKAKELAIEDFKTSGEFKAAVIDSATTYFSEGFEFCKRQLLHQFPNLGVDVANMAMDPSFAEEEEARKEGEDPAAGVAPDV